MKLLEIGAGLGRLAVHAHLAHHVDRAAEPGGVGEPDRGAEHALLLEVPDPPPDRGRRGADLLGERGVAEAGVALQRPDDSPVDRVQVKFIFTNMLYRETYVSLNASYGRRL